MKRTVLITTTTLIFLFITILPAIAWQQNYPLPQSKDTLRILGVGNSFTEDGMMYLPDLLEAAGIKNVVLGRLFYGGCSLEQHCKFYAKDTAAYVYHKSVRNKWERITYGIKLKDAVADEPWDVVVLQQSSGLSGIYESYHPWLEQLIRIVRLHSTNAAACLAWQQTWSYAINSTHKYFGNYHGQSWMMYECITGALKALLKDSSLEIIIPTGTAIQSLRVTFPGTPSDFTRDGYHLDLCEGRYTAACAWFQAIIAPVFRTTVKNNTFRVKKKDSRRMSDEEAIICQLAAQLACINMFEPVNLKGSRE